MKRFSENRLGDVRGALGTGHQRHQLRLQVGGETRNGAVETVTGLMPAPLRATRDALVVDRDHRAGLRQHIERRLQEFGPRAGELDIAARHRHRHRIGAGLDAVRQHRVPCAVQLAHASMTMRGVPAPETARPCG